MSEEYYPAVLWDEPGFRGWHRPAGHPTMAEAIDDTLAQAGLDTGPGPYPPRGKAWRLKGATDRSPPLFEVMAALKMEPWLGPDGASWQSSRIGCGRWPEDRARQLVLLNLAEGGPGMQLVAVGAQP